VNDNLIKEKMKIPAAVCALSFLAAFGCGASPENDAPLNLANDLRIEGFAFEGGPLDLADLPWLPGQPEEKGEAYSISSLFGVQSNSHPCYATNAPTFDCAFPVGKTFHFTLDTSACGVVPGAPVISFQQKSDVIAGITFALNSMNGTGGTSWSKSSATGAGVVNVAVHCGSLQSTPFTVAETIPTVLKTLNANLPVDPTTLNDQHAFLTFARAEIIIDPSRVIGVCPGCTSLQLQDMAGAATEHECGHAMGFGHFGASFRTNIMFPSSRTGDKIQPFPAEFENALIRYDTTTPAAGHVFNDGLNHYSPCTGVNCN
jgi:hypothetical protein